MRYVLLALLVLLSAPADASTIQISIATRVVVGPSGVRVDIDLRNDGDEPAVTVVPSVEFQGRVLAGAALAALAPGMPQSTVIEVPHAGPAMPRGRWPVLVRVAYSDGRGWTAEAIHADVARFSDMDATPLRLNVPHARVASETTVRLSLDRRGIEAPVRLALTAPVGLILTPRVMQHVRGASDDLPITISNMGAAPGSRLPLIVLAEFDTPAGHETVIAIAMVDVGTDDRRAKRMAVIGVLVGITAMVWIAIVWTSHRRRGARG